MDMGLRVVDLYAQLNATVAKRATRVRRSRFLPRSRARALAAPTTRGTRWPRERRAATPSPLRLVRFGMCRQRRALRRCRRRTRGHHRRCATATARTTLVAIIGLLLACLGPPARREHRRIEDSAEQRRLVSQCRRPSLTRWRAAFARHLVFGFGSPALPNQETITEVSAIARERGWRSQPQLVSATLRRHGIALV
jgi:hypothetical protein